MNNLFYIFDLNIEIFKFLDIFDLKNLHNTNKNFNISINKFSILNYKKSWKQIIIDSSCIHCNNICITHRLCDNCIFDSCWKCFRKIGNENLMTESIYYPSNREYYSIMTCIDGCQYICNICKFNFNFNNVLINEKNCSIICKYC